jgi:hypothetical protein
MFLLSLDQAIGRWPAPKEISFAEMNSCSKPLSAKPHQSDFFLEHLARSSYACRESGELSSRFNGLPVR